MKQVTSLRYIYKLESNKLVKEKWDITIDNKDKKELVKKRQLIGLADSQGFRFIKEIAKIKDSKEENEFRKYIASIVFNDISHFDYACEYGIKINGKKFKRFVGTSGGIKKNTILFVSEDIYDELERRANNGRDITVPMVSAKLEAYKSLIFSTSIPVTMPKGIAVVHGCITKFKEDTIFINDKGVRGGKIKEPTVQKINNMEIELNATDGLGICKPSLMKQWTQDILGKEITYNEMFGGVCIRNAFTKGMIFPFDIDEWIDEYNNGNSVVKDVWGNEVDLKKCELIITDDVFKLTKSYSSLESYLTNCKENNYTFAVCKTSEIKLDKYRTLNYQYLQSFDMKDKDINKLIMPTVNRIKECICGDYETTLKYLGVKQNMSKEDMKEFTFKEALALNKNLMNDEFVIKKINNMIKKEIDETKIGKIRVKGNYQIASGDVFALMQSICGHEVTGILKKGEFYSSFWDNENIDKVLIMRSPMTVHNNIVKGNICHNDLARKWFKYMKNIFVLNAWDNTMSAENGQDFDGDTNFTTNDSILIKNYKKELTIVCAEHTANKEVITEESLRISNKNGFGNNVGTVTNRATSMYDIICTIDKNKEEDKESYNIMKNRISICQLLQQAVIDSAKTGFVTTTMPMKWYTKSKCKNEIDLRLCCDKKPYFMMYIYKQVKREYNSWFKQWNDECYFDFGCTLKDLREKIKRTDEEEDFLIKAYDDMPVTDNNCLMNRLCHMVEKEFDGFVNEKLSIKEDFDYTSLMYKDIECNFSLENNIVQIIKEYNDAADYQIKNKTLNKDDNEKEKISMINSYKTHINNFIKEKEYDKKQFVNTFIKITYTKNKQGKQFLWDLFGEEIIDNLIEVKNR